MSASTRDDLSLPFVGLAVVLTSLVAVDYLWYPLFNVESEVTLTYGGLLVALALAYGYRPIRESRYGALVISLVVMLFAAVHYDMGFRGPLMPYGLFTVGLAVFCYQLYKFGSEATGRGQMS